MTDAKLRQTLAAFDDAALTTMASKGLLRRAQRDLEAGKVALLEALDAGARVQADGEEVRIGPEGPAAATCSCRAAGVCRHRLAAVLVLRRSETPAGAEDVEAPAERDDGEEDARSQEPAAAAGDPLAEILALSPAAIARWAGKATLRAAVEMLEAGAAPAIRVEGASLAIRLSPEAPEVRFLAGQGLDGMLSKAPRSRRKALHAAAVLAVRRAQAPEDAAPESFGEVVEPADTAAPDPGFLAAVLRCLRACVQSGFNQAPLVLEERLFALSVSSRADSLPRLSALLRTIAARVRAKREHDFSLDLEAYLALVAEAYALARALEAGPAESPDPGRRAALKGQVRQDYRPVGRLTLYGMGARRWRTAAGARGVTGYFYAPEENRWYSAGLARAHGHDAGFSPRRAYEQEGLWGAGGLSKLCRSKVILQRAAAAADGRLSLSKEVSASASPWPFRKQALQGWPLAFRDWERLEAELRARFAPGLSRPRPGPRPFVLLPAGAGSPSFDDKAQEIVWPLRDAQGRWLGLTLSHSAENAAVVTNFEAALRGGQPWAVAALATAGRGRFALEPFSLFLQGAEGGCHNVGLDRTQGRGGRAGGGFLRRLGQSASSLLGRHAATPAWASPTGAAARSLTEAADALLGLAELGGILDGGGLDRIAALARGFEACGLAPLAEALDRLARSDRQDFPDRLLETAHLLTCAQALLKPAPLLRDA